ncbi:hypothetical protein B0T16DRAFT_48896 [Cercophora newfieldiana]|uniref:Uncharacterized protein n=1 Tax=Cercophora newfieldiana TaxID=92897 RepID=A0AA39YT11_9PEZI|nr:hypothetical protein B0T16DRAFT_48896 [Cercophora newfieldiana]
MKSNAISTPQFYHRLLDETLSIIFRCSHWVVLAFVHAGSPLTDLNWQKWLSHLDWLRPSPLPPVWDLAILICWTILATLVSAEVIDARMSHPEKIVCCISGIALAHGPLIVLWTARCSNQRRYYRHCHHRSLASGTAPPRRVVHFRNRERRDARGVRIRSRLPPVRRIMKP